MAKAMSLVGILFALVIIAASGFMNFQYVAGWGSNKINSQIFGAVSVALDGIKAMLPFFILWGMKSRKTFHVIVGSVMFPALVGFSLLSALGFVAENRNHVTSGQETITSKLADTKNEIGRQREKLAAQPKARGAGVIDQALNAARQNKRFASSKQCTEATAKKSRAFCSGYFQLMAEAEAAKAKAATESLITRLVAKKNTLLASGANKKADPQAGLIAKLTGLEIKDTQTALSVFIAVLVEMVAAFGLYISTAHGGNSIKAKKTKRRKASNDNKTSRETPPAQEEIIFRETPVHNTQPLHLVLA